MTTGSLIAVLKLLLLLLVFAHSSEIVELTDATFEHQTQASTGMTTGSWFVLFKADKCAHCAKVQPEFEKLAQDEELEGIVLATVNVPTNRQTAARFDNKGFPTLLYLHRGKQYKFKGQRTYERLKQFLLEGIKTMAPLDIPKPVTAWEVSWRDFQSAVSVLYKQVQAGGTIGYSILIVTCMCFGLFLLILTACFWPSSSEKEKKE